MTGCPLIHFKEVGVLRVKEPNVKKANAIPDGSPRVADYALEALARCLYPMMVTFFESTENVPGGIAESDEKVRVAG